MKLGKKKLSGGRYSYYLDYRINGKREREFLKLYYTPGARAENENSRALAENIKAMRDHEIKSGNFGMIAAHKKKTDFIKYFHNYCDNYTKANYKNYYATLWKFMEFVKQESIPCSAISEQLIKYFKDFLHSHPKLHGETPHTYFKIFKQVLEQAAEDGLFKVSPGKKVKNENPNTGILTKEVLSDAEIKKLSRTPCGSPETKRAFLFAYQTGFGRAELVSLKWKDINMKEGVISFMKRAKSRVVGEVPLSKTAMKYLGKPANPDDNVFKLPSTKAMNKAIKHWTNRAKITKHITFYCGRHSFATSIHQHGYDILTVSKLLLHTSLKHTLKYTHVNDKMKRKAVNSLPEY